MRLRLEALAVRCVLILAVCLTALTLVDVAVVYPGWAMIIAAGYAYRKWRRRGGSGDAYGSARSSDLIDLWRNNLLGDKGLIVGTCGFLDKPGKAEGVRALFSPRLPSSIAARLFLAAFLGRSWMER